VGTTTIKDAKVAELEERLNVCGVRLDEAKTMPDDEARPVLDEVAREHQEIRLEMSALPQRAAARAPSRSSKKSAAMTRSARRPNAWTK
jgi:hypothetical protein